ncbi:MAG: hypothetical protein IT249_16545 [Chitinophagaceae bacterium]|nr:hypothetical protein [Chitinophagaceae bacterium]
MKKLLVILAIGAFAACNNASETPVETAAEAAVDSVKAAGNAAVDSAKATVDSTKAAVGAAVDSAKAVVDSLKK